MQQGYPGPSVAPFKWYSSCNTVILDSALASAGATGVRCSLRVSELQHHQASPANTGAPGKLPAHSSHPVLAELAPAPHCVLLPPPNRSQREPWTFVAQPSPALASVLEEDEDGNVPRIRRASDQHKANRREVAAPIINILEQIVETKSTELAQICRLV